MKTIHLFIALLLSFTLAACSQQSKPSSASVQQTQQSVATLSQGSNNAYRPTTAYSAPGASAPAASYNARTVIPPKSASRASASNNVLNVDDKVTVAVFNAPNLSAQNLTVEQNGNISLPLIGALRIKGLTIPQAENAIRTKLTTYLQNPKVTLSRTSKSITEQITVEGEVKSPGVFPIRGNLTFIQAIALANGVTELANVKNILFYRDGQQYKLDLNQVRTGQTQDPLLAAEDRIVILRDTFKELKRVTVEGEVRTPGVFPIKGNISFLQAIALAQGVTELADTKNVLFYRNGQQFPINLELVRTGQIQDPVLLGDDRVVVLRDKSKVFKRNVKDYIPAVLSPFSIFK